MAQVKFRRTGITVLGTRLSVAEFSSRAK
jgi:hypothetical protein